MGKATTHEITLDPGEVIIHGAIPRSKVDRIYRLLEFADGYEHAKGDEQFLAECAEAADWVLGDYTGIVHSNGATNASAVDILDEIEDEIRTHIEEHNVPAGCYLGGHDPGDVVVWEIGGEDYDEIGGEDYDDKDYDD